MRANIVIVHNEPPFAVELPAALRATGHEVAVFADPVAAWDTIRGSHTVDILITRIQFPPRQSNGVALANLALSCRGETGVLFAAPPDLAPHTEGLSAFIAAHADVPGMLDTIAGLLPRPHSPRP